MGQQCSTVHILCIYIYINILFIGNDICQDSLALLRPRSKPIRNDVLEKMSNKMLFYIQAFNLFIRISSPIMWSQYKMHIQYIRRKLMIITANDCLTEIFCTFILPCCRLFFVMTTLFLESSLPLRRTYLCVAIRQCFPYYYQMILMSCKYEIFMVAFINYVEYRE